MRFAALSADGKRVATGCDDGSVRIFDAAIGRLIRSLGGLQQMVRALGFSLDGARVVGTANEMLEEAVRMRRIPGIVFADGPSGRRARVAGTGIDVFEVIQSYRGMNRTWEHLREAYHWLTEIQLRAALAYAEAYPQEVDARLEREASLTEDEIWRRYPFTRPR